MNFGEVLQKSWKIIWKNKILWLFGLLASCGRSGGGGGSGGSGAGGGNQNSFSDFSKADIFENLPPWMEEIGRSFERMVEDGTIWLVVAGVLVFGLVMVVVSLLLGSIGRAGLAKGAWMADAEETHLTLKLVWVESKRYFWRVLLMSLLVAAVLTVAVLILMIPVILLAVATLGIGLICLVPLICLLVPVGIAIGILQELAVVAITGEDKGVIDSLRRAWAVGRANLGPVVVMALILYIGGGVIGLLIGLPAILVLVPIVIGMIAGTQTAVTGGFVAAGVMLLFYLPVAILLSSVLQAYLGSAWALTYRRLIGNMDKESAEKGIQVLEDILPDAEGETPIE